jgi:hypothetical protein
MFVHCLLLEGVAFGEPIYSLDVEFGVLLLRVIDHHGGVFFLLFIFFLVVYILHVFGHFIDAKTNVIGIRAILKFFLQRKRLNVENIYIHSKFTLFFYCRL